jgi:tRNA-specific adenosine deaminase 1
MKATKDEIVRFVVDFYDNKLGKKGKPQKAKNEWTVLSAFVLQKTNNGQLEILALATGTKCLGQNEVQDDDQGARVHDSHAEVVAKRAFSLYLIHEVEKCLSGQPSILEKADGNSDKVQLPEDHSLYFYTSLPPCGDATIAPKIKEDQDDERPAKRPKIGDIHRTGAKCADDPRGLEDANYHILGAVRTKPGRGDPTLSLSCSDKMAKWCQVGFQGSLLAAFFPRPLLPDSIIIGSDQFCWQSVSRALFDRFGRKASLEIEQTTVDFADGPKAKNRPLSLACDASIFYYNQIQGVIVQGRKQGCIKKHFGTTKAQSPLCRKAIGLAFTDLLGQKMNNLNVEGCTYSELKAKCREQSCFYESQWSLIKAKLAKTNVVKAYIDLDIN